MKTFIRKEKSFPISQARSLRPNATLDWVDSFPCSPAFATTYNNAHKIVSGHGKFDISLVDLLEPNTPRSFGLLIVEAKTGWIGIEPLPELWGTSPGAYRSWFVERLENNFESSPHINVSFLTVGNPHLQGAKNIGGWQVFIGARRDELEVTYRYDIEISSQIMVIEDNPEYLT